MAMPTLSNTRHERFAQNLANGMSAAEAYEAAGYKPNRQSASLLLTNVDIKNRVAELQESIAEKAEWTAVERLQMLERIALANAEADARVAISAIAEANKMQGSHAPAKVAQTTPDGQDMAPVSRIVFTPVYPEERDGD